MTDLQELTYGELVALLRKDLLLDFATDVLPPTWKSYTPTWSCANTAPVVGNGKLQGQYIQIGQLCVVTISLQAGTTTTGGRGATTFSLPVLASTSFEQELLCKLYAAANGSQWVGFAYVGSATAICNPQFPLTAGVSNLGPFQNADNTGAAGTGVPVIAANFALTNGSNLQITGSYWTA